MLAAKRIFARYMPRGSKHLAATPLVVALGLWVCVMVITAAILVPWTGWGLIAPLGLALLVALLAVCWAICVPFERAQQEWRRTVAGAFRRREE